MSSQPLTALILASSVVAGLVGSATAAADLLGDWAGGEGSVVGAAGKSAAPTTTVAVATASATTSVVGNAVVSAGLDEATILTYLDALDTVDASPALAVASPGSAAWRYAEHQAAVEEANREAGLGVTTNHISSQGAGRFESCSAVAGEPCAVFADFVADEEGRIVSFTVNGVDITARIGDPSDPVTFGPVTAQVRSAYRTVTGDALVVVVEVEVTTDLVVTSVPMYVDAADREVERNGGTIAPRLTPGPATTMAFSFPGVDPGGRVVWEMTPPAGGDATVVALEVPKLHEGADVAVLTPATTSTGLPAGSQPPTTSAAGVASQLIDSLGPVLASTMGAVDFIEPDVTCLDAAVRTLGPSVGDAVEELVSEPTLFHSLENHDAAAVTMAYLGCVDAELLPLTIAFVTTRAVDDPLICIAEAWSQLITAEDVASSLAYGNGLDDLPADIADRMTLAAAQCVPDVEWWIEDEVTVLMQSGLSDDEASCMTRALVDSFGVGPIIRRRVLTLRSYPVPRAELEGIDLVGRCGVDPLETNQLGPPGTCLAGFGAGTAETQIVDCSQPHNAEIATVTDLADEFPVWPGAQALRDMAGPRCLAELQALAGDITGYAAGWDIPLRHRWEQSVRSLTCSLIRPDYSSWTGPSGLVPTVAPTPSLTLNRGDFDVDVPAVDGYTYNLIPIATSIPWAQQVELPDDVGGLAFAVEQADADIGSLVVVEDFGLATYVDQLFSAPLLLGSNPAASPDDTIAPAPEARAVWRPFSGMPVVTAAAPGDDVGQWVWGHSGLVWIAVGQIAMEDWIAGFIAAQQEAQPSDPYDYGLLAGSLFADWLQEVPGYLFVDLPVATTLQVMPETIAGDCAEQMYLGNVLALDDPDVPVVAADDLAITVATISGGCAEAGFFDDLEATLDRLAVPHDVIDGVPVRRDDTTIYVVDGNDVLHLASSDPTTLVEMEPFITQLVTRHRNPEVLDFNPLSVGTCLFRGSQRSADPEDRPVYVTDCATPHQGEIFHNLVLESAPGATYPGDTSVSALADQICVDAFASYIGTDFESSRLNILYFYPSAETWADGDRTVVCIVYGSEPEELLRGSVAHTAQ